MDILARGLQSYLTALGAVLMLVLVWGANRYLTDSTTAETGWPVLIAITLGLVVVVVVGRYLAGRAADKLPIVGRTADTRDWNSRR
jgi:predicted lysophospholipase L1 biosynthesis ABC-type transport system permease subunit